MMLEGVPRVPQALLEESEPVQRESEDFVAEEAQSIMDDDEDDLVSESEDTI